MTFRQKGPTDGRVTFFQLRNTHLKAERSINPVKSFKARCPVACAARYWEIATMMTAYGSHGCICW